jgi:hypothetical protein
MTETTTPAAVDGTVTPLVRELRCPHGKTMFSDRTDGGVRRIHGGVPACCFDMLCTPAAGNGFIIVQRDGRQKRIHDGLTGVALVGANKSSSGSDPRP